MIVSGSAVLVDVSLSSHTPLVTAGAGISTILCSTGILEAGLGSAAGGTTSPAEGSSATGSLRVSHSDVITESKLASLSEDS